MRSHDYGRDILSTPKRKKVPEITAEPGLVVEDPASGFCGAVVKFEYGQVVLEDRHGRHRLFPLNPAGFLVDGRPVTLVKPAPQPQKPRISASGSVKVEGLRAKTAKASRIWVEGKHDAELVERVWGHDLRVEGIVVEPLGGVDELPGLIREFGTAPNRRLGVLVDHLVPGTKESRVVEQARRLQPYATHVRILGHPYVDVWQGVRPARLGLDAWPVIPRGTSWKHGICAHLGWPHADQADIARAWKQVLGTVRTYADLEPTLLASVEELIDFVTEPGH